MHDKPFESIYHEIKRGMIKADSDPLRPTYHFRPPAQWMNDPNGTIFHDGIFEVFYQFNPLSDTFGRMHWGHARTRDFITWEHLPVALSPRTDFGETQCWSGCCVLRPDSTPVLIYTSLQGRALHEQPDCVRIAVGSRDFSNWKQIQSPVIGVEDVPVSVRNDWRDPYSFEKDGVRYLVVGAALSERDEQPVVLLFRADDQTFQSWSYVGELFESDDKFTFLECPNFLEVDNRWILLLSAKKPVEYHVGDFGDPHDGFAIDRSGLVDHSIEYYATNTAVDDDGRTVVFAWIRGFPKGRGWNGCLALPREIHVDQHGALIQRPIKEIENLRRHHARMEGPVTEPVTISDASIYNMELIVVAQTEQRGSLTVLFESEDETVFRVSVSQDLIHVAGINVPLESPQPGARELRIFTDRSVIEVFADGGRHCVTRVVDTLVRCNRIRILQDGPIHCSVIEHWSMAPLQYESDAFFGDGHLSST